MAGACELVVSPTQERGNQESEIMNTPENLLRDVEAAPSGGPVRRTRDRIRIANRSGIDDVRFRGVYFDERIGFTLDLRDGENASLQDLPFGSYGVVAYRIADQQGLDSIVYPISASLGFALILMADTQSTPTIYRLVGEPFMIEADANH